MQRLPAWSTTPVITPFTAATPVYAAGAVDVVVTNPDTQSGTLTSGYTYEAPLIHVGSIEVTIKKKGSL